MIFGDARVASALLRWALTAQSVVSWNARHCEGEPATRVVTSLQFHYRERLSHSGVVDGVLSESLVHRPHGVALDAPTFALR